MSVQPFTPISSRTRLGDLLKRVLDTVADVFTAADVGLPTRRYVAFGVPAVDCEQVVVEFVQLYHGPVGAQATEPVRCENSPRSCVMSVTIWRTTPTEGVRGGPPTADSLGDVAYQCLTDTWLLLDVATQCDQWAYPAGIFSDVAPVEPQGGLGGARLNLTMLVP